MLVKISNSNFWKFRENEGVGALHGNRHRSKQ